MERRRFREGYGGGSTRREVRKFVFRFRCAPCGIRLCGKRIPIRPVCAIARGRFRGGRIRVRKELERRKSRGGVFCPVSIGFSNVLIKPSDFPLIVGNCWRKSG